MNRSTSARAALPCSLNSMIFLPLAVADDPGPASPPGGPPLGLLTQDRLDAVRVALDTCLVEGVQDHHELPFSQQRRGSTSAPTVPPRAGRRDAMTASCTHGMTASCAHGGTGAARAGAPEIAGD